MTKTFVLEVGCEEIPSRFMPGILANLSELMASMFKKERLQYTDIMTTGTYRRLIVSVKGLDSKQRSLEEEVKGPPKKIAFSEEGEPRPAAVGFAKRLGIELDQLKVKTLDGTDYLVGTKREEGLSVQEVLSQQCPAIIKQLKLPIAMRWGATSHQFIRPIHWVLSLYGEAIIPLSLMGCDSGRLTYGHRFLRGEQSVASTANGEALEISSADELLTQLESVHVIADHCKRQSIIEKALRVEGIDVSLHGALLEEVLFLVEYPTILGGAFPTDFLEIPEIALEQCMKKHQKYFPVSKDGKLTNQFVLVADSVTKKSKETIIKGNENVIRARLADVDFFWEEDRKTTLESRVPALEKVIFQKGMGSLLDKIKRIELLSQYIQKACFSRESGKVVGLTAQLCKADLVTHMVIELPDLQGIMGALYARDEGLDPQVAQGIEEHYWPRFSGDKVPSTYTGICVGLADKIDTIVSCFANGLIPTGSQDPWGVRRAVYGVLRIIDEHQLDIDIEEIINEAYKGLSMGTENQKSLKAFFQQRLGAYFIEKGLRYDSVEAVSHYGLSSVKEAYRIGRQLDEQRLTNPEGFKQLVDTAVRVQRLAPDNSQPVNDRLFRMDIEKQTWQQVQKVEAELSGTIEPEIYLSTLGELTGPMSTYFEEVMVMSKDQEERDNRLAFLFYTNKLYANIANFEKIVTGS